MPLTRVVTVTSQTNGKTQPDHTWRARIGFPVGAVAGVSRRAVRSTGESLDELTLSMLYFALRRGTRVLGVVLGARS
jgi:hypothetical protein